MSEYLSVEQLITLAIREDVRDGDHTSLATIPSNARGEAILLIKDFGVLAGIDIARMVFEQFDNALIFIPLLDDGANVSPGDIAFRVAGSSRSLLTAERLVLNFMQRMSGIATHTRQLVNLISDLPVTLLDTRKTTPNMRVFEKMAVKIGGGGNHRFGLFDMILVKNNHIDFAGGLTSAVKSTLDYLQKNNKNLPIEVEVRNMDELNELLQTEGVQRVMLDNFSVADMKKAVEMINGRLETEASGGITNETLRAYAETGVNFISVGALTHQIRSLDMSLRAIR
ncbi:carboxylating nicotinate-nucleotide diphosphorylase [Bacteroidales bacterium]